MSPQLMEEAYMCGIVGIIGTPNAAMESYFGLLMLQHRGQDAAGIIAFDEMQQNFQIEKSSGLITNAIDENKVAKFNSDVAIAHTRYSTIGKTRPQEIQPMFMNYPHGIAMVHNGNIINTNNAIMGLHQKKRIMYSKNDVEIMMNIFADRIQKSDNCQFSDIKDAIHQIFEQLNGSYSALTILANKGLIAFKDPNGIRPMCWGKKKNPTGSKIPFSYAFSSESNSLSALEFEAITEMKAGELIYISNEGKVHQFSPPLNIARPCMFEWFYFANADSTIWNKNIYSMRLKFGHLLAKKIDESKINLDIIVPVPDTARPSAIGISEGLKVPYREVLIKNRYTQRTFILNSQKERSKMVNVKLNVVAQEVQGKNVLLVDDSIVRGTTSKRIISLLKKAGAKNIYFASTCPPIKHPCFYGIDFPTKSELIANEKDVEEISFHIGAKETFYLEIEDMIKTFAEIKVCHACLSGEYPTTTTDTEKMISERIQNEKIDLPRIC